MRSIGLDVGRDSAEVAIVGVDGRTRSGGRVRATPEDLAAFARTLGPDDRVVLEATTNTWAIVELLETHAGQVIVSNPLRTRAIADAKTKTDTIDAATLAELLAADYLPAVWQPDAATRALRRRVAARAALVAERTRLRNRIGAVLIRNLVTCPLSDTFGKRGRAWLTTVALPEDEREQVDATLRLLDGLAVEIGQAEAGIARVVVDDVRVRQLLTIPGIGPHTRGRSRGPHRRRAPLQPPEQARGLSRPRSDRAPVGSALLDRTHQPGRPGPHPDAPRRGRPCRGPGPGATASLLRPRGCATGALHRRGGGGPQARRPGLAPAHP